MFPFTLPGAQFLGLYAVFAVLLVAAFWYYVNSGSSATVRLTELTADPYQIAHMRGGEPETVRVAIVNLVDRGLLTAEGRHVRVTRADAADFVRRPLDRAIVKCSNALELPATLASDRTVQAACAAYEGELQRKGLLPSASARATRNTLMLIVGALLVGVCLARLTQAFAQSQTNVFFLIAITAIALWAAAKIWHIRTTVAGSQALSSLRTLMQRLRARRAQLVQGGATNESLLLIAVFGIYELPFTFVRRLYPRRKRSDSSCGGGGGCGGSCGGSCGGGGCGGCGGD